MRRPVSVKSVFLFPPCGSLAFEPSRLSRRPSIRTLGWSDFRSVPVGRPHFSRCCYLRIDLGSPLFDGSWPGLSCSQLNSAVELDSSDPTLRHGAYHCLGVPHGLIDLP